MPVINDVSGLNPIPVWAIVAPDTVDEIQRALRETDRPVSIGGGHFSMGGHTASPDSLHLDLRKLNKILSFSPSERVVRVQAGVRWCDLQKFLDAHDLSIQIMQTYANFTVGGSLSVNVHGRYIGAGPLVISVRSISVVLADGSRQEASRLDRPELFWGCIGGFGGLGIIVEAELELVANVRVERSARKMPIDDYPKFFRESVRGANGVVFHNADIYAPDFKRIRAVTWTETARSTTRPERLQWQRRRYLLEKYLIWAVTETPFGKWRREYLLDPLLYARSAVHWRNFEAGYDAAELEPLSRERTTYVLQEYFAPVEKFEACVRAMGQILQRHAVNVLNISIRHANTDPGTILSWARGETFAFVLYYKQRTRDNARDRVAVWTRELIDAITALGGTYYLPYQLLATSDQFHRAYPAARQFFELKRELDPQYRLRGALWDKYYAPTVDVALKHPVRIGAAAGDAAPVNATASGTLFHALMGKVKWHDAMYRFLQNVFRLHPEDRFLTLIREACERHATDEAVYRHLQRELPGIRPLLTDLRFAIPALRKQKLEMCRQTLELLPANRTYNGYLEIGSTGRYISVLRRHLRLEGPVLLLHEVAPSNSPADILERGRLRQLGEHVPLRDYAPIDPARVPDGSLDLLTCYVGLHHMTPTTLTPFLESIARALRPGGMFILRDHDVTSDEMFRFVSLIHTVFNAGTGATWEQDHSELRYFTSVDEWIRRLASVGLRHTGPRLFQPHDPSDNALLAFERIE